MASLYKRKWATRRSLRAPARQGSRRQDVSAYESLFLNSPVGIFQSTPKGRYRAANPAFAKMLGYDSAAQLIQEVEDISRLYVDPAERDRITRLLREDGQVVGHEIYLRQRGGAEIWMSVTAKAVKDSTGSVEFFDGFAEDITDRKRAEEALAQRNAYMELAQQMADVGYWSFELSSQALTWSDQMPAIMGWAPSDKPFSLEDYARRIHPDDRQSCVAAAQAALAGVPSSIHARVLQPGGGIHHVHAHFQPQFAADGSVRAVFGVARNVTDTVDAQTAFRASEEKYRVISENMTDLVCLMTPDLRLQYVSPSIKVLLGYEPDQPVGQSVAVSFLASEREQQVVLLAKRALEGRKVEMATVRVRRKDGSAIFVDMSLRPILDADGIPEKLLLVGRDITERVRAEEALHESESRYRRLFENASVGLFRTTLSGQIIDINPSLARMFGYDSPDGFRAGVKSAADLFVNPAIRSSLVDRVRATGAPVQGEVQYFRRDQSVFTANLSFRLDRGNGDGPAVLEGFIEDITDRKLSEEALRESERRFRTLVESLPMLVMLFGPSDYRPVYVSPKGVGLTGYTEEELRTGRQWWVHSDDENPMRELYAQTMASKKGFLDVEYKAVRKDGSTWTASSSWIPMLGKDGDFLGSLFITRDVTSRKKSEEQRALLESQLLQAQKMETVGQLAGGIAHDLNNLLTPVIGYATILRDDIPFGHRSRNDALEILAAAHRARDLIRQLLAFARKQTMEMKVLELNELVAEFARMLARTMRENVQIVTDLHPGLALVEADAGQVGQVIMNLAVNAHDAMPEGGTLSLSTSNEVLREEDVQGREGMVAGDYVCITVQDTGVGIDESVLGRIFEPFFTTKEMGRGTGLGLSTAYGVVKQHHGDITVHSTPGKGTIFRVYLPFARCLPEVHANIERPRCDLRDARVLLVEDDENVRAIARRALERAGSVVLEACGGEDALAVAGRYGGSLDLLVTDVVMPDLNGHELYRRLSESWQGLRALFMSGYPADVLDREGVVAEGHRFLAKPFSPDELIREASQALGC